LVAGINIELVGGKIDAKSTPPPLVIAPISPQPIGVITLYPGIQSEVLENTLQQPVNALILLSYGVGNAPQTPTMLAQLQSAYDNNIVIVNCTQCTRGKVNMNGYATGHALQDVGVLSGLDMTPEATLAKLHYLLSQNMSTNELRTKITDNLRGELTK